MNTQLGAQVSLSNRTVTSNVMVLGLILAVSKMSNVICNKAIMFPIKI